MKRLGIFCLVIVMVVGCLPLSVGAVELDIPAKAAILIDAATGTVLYEQNAHTPLPPASVTKVMTMLLIMEAIDDGRIGWEDTVTASATAAAKGGSQIYLKEGETMSVSTLLKSVAVSSANDAACALAEHIAGSETAFVNAMNQRAKELGMNETNFVNCTGLDDDETAQNHRTSAYDIALMSRELLVKHPDIKKFTTIWMDTVRDGSFGLSNTNKLVRFYQGATGLKTGYTSQAGFCLSASAERDGMELIAVVLGCDTSAERFAACKSMLDHGFASYALIAPKLDSQVAVPVKLGTQQQVQAVPASDGSVLIDKSQKNTVNVKVELSDGVEAPVSQGQRLGTMTVTSGEQILAEIPLVAAQPVARLSWGQIFVRMLRSICLG
ncbi:MAG: D-alanyl-D-alanine carboxypeptidase [Oscillospiraceae bacterium]|nr:D-alanyl-D-alanine carboxypeptidase [Oscillospiraceae bacterium]